MIEDYRKIFIIVIITLCLLDLGLTYYYVSKYKKWQPNKPYRLIEMNPLLVILWNKLGLIVGMIVGSVLILTLNYIIAKEAHPIIVLILFIVIGFALFNHYNNITLLDKLIDKYPTGYLPTEIFGNVEGNNVR